MCMCVCVWPTCVSDSGTHSVCKNGDIELCKVVVSRITSKAYHMTGSVIHQHTHREREAHCDVSGPS